MTIDVTDYDRLHYCAKKEYADSTRESKGHIDGFNQNCHIPYAKDCIEKLKNEKITEQKSTGAKSLLDQFKEEHHKLYTQGGLGELVQANKNN